MESSHKTGDELCSSGQVQPSTSDALLTGADLVSPRVFVERAIASNVGNSERLISRLLAMDAFSEPVGALALQQFKFAELQSTLARYVLDTAMVMFPAIEVPKSDKLRNIQAMELQRALAVKMAQAAAKQAA